jgi:transcriptional regulator with XRE-family HTH domain
MNDNQHKRAKNRRKSPWETSAELPADLILTRREVAERLRISVRTLTRLERDRKIELRVQLSDRRYGYRTSTIESYLDARGGAS